MMPASTGPSRGRLTPAEARWAISNNNEIAGWANMIAGGASMMMGMAVIHAPKPAKWKMVMKPGWNNLDMLPTFGMMPGIVLRAAVAINDFGQILAAGATSTSIDPVGRAPPLSPMRSS